MIINQLELQVLLLAAVRAGFELSAEGLNSEFLVISDEELKSRFDAATLRIFDCREQILRAAKEGV